MPELPEVETVRRRLAPLIEGKTITTARILDRRLTSAEPPAIVADRLTGARISLIGRRGKYLVWELEDAPWLVVHLRMTGNLLHDRVPAPGPHLRATLTLDDGTVVSYTDLRRFGTWTLVEQDDIAAYFAPRLGPEPIEATFEWRTLRDRLAGRRTALKAALLDQRCVAGVGNIYADEALFAARLHPETVAGSLSTASLKRLATALRDVLLLGIEAQGATIRDFRTPAGGYGSMQESFQVFERTNEPCPRCLRPIIKIRVGGRGTHLCPRCQPRPRRA